MGAAIQIKAHSAVAFDATTQGSNMPLAYTEYMFSNSPYVKLSRISLYWMNRRLTSWAVCVTGTIDPCGPLFFAGDLHACRTRWFQVLATIFSETVCAVSCNNRETLTLCQSEIDNFGKNYSCNHREKISKKLQRAVADVDHREGLRLISQVLL